MPPGDVPAPARPPLLVAALVLLGAEALALAVFAGAIVVESVAAGAQSLGGALSIAAFLGVLAAVVAAATRALVRGRRWGRGLAVTWQVLQGAIAVAQFGPAPVVATVLLVVALVVVVGLLVPGSIAATSD